MYQILIVVALILVVGFFYLKNNSEIEELPETEIQLWVMIETNDYFLTQSEIKIEDDAIALIEGMGLGESDGHSSGAHQFDFNFFNVQDFGKAKIAINELLQSKYPKLNYVISDNYETTFDKVN
jgi:hypothetical protein